LRLKNRYGITLDDYDFILKKQNGVCAICGRPPKEGKNLHIDHCHEKSVVRGLLCFRCNFGLSYFSEDVDMMEKAFLYLKNDEILSKELSGIVDRRERKQQKIEKRKAAIVSTAQTKEISEMDKKKMSELYKSGSRLCDIVRDFSQYSRSAVNRAAKSEE